MMNPTLPRRAAAIAIAGTALATAPAGSQTLQYALAPAYAEGGNGAGGWYRVPVSVTYACPPPPGWVVVSCPPPETLGAGTLQATDAKARRNFHDRNGFCFGQAAIIAGHCCTWAAAP